jgi:predicted O-linked N-acetylglucosamine transferase (SPINDLY family)
MESSLKKAQKLQAAGEIAAAEDAYRQLLKVSGDDPKILQPLSQICYQRGNFIDSIVFLRRLCAVDRKNALNYFSLAGVCKEIGRVREAIENYQQAISLKPDFVNAYTSLGVLYYELLEYQSSIACYNNALLIAPNDIKARYNLSLSQVRIGLVREAISNICKVLELRPDLHNVRSSYLFNLHYLADINAERLSAAHVQWGILHAEPLYPINPPLLHEPSRGKKIRVGYVSPDLRRHSVAYFMSSILEGHDRSTVESYCYSDSVKIDDFSILLKGSSDYWRDTASWNDENLYQQIRADRIDILVDLAGHSARNRLLVFARKPAPVQVSYLGYPDITGLSSIDFRLTDGWADPIGEQMHTHGERLVRLPGGFLCYDPIDTAPMVSELPALTSESITFASFNNLPKINEEVIAVWAGILKAIPLARLLLKSRGLGDELGRRMVYDGFAEHGVDTGRIECVGFVPEISSHLEHYRRVDIALDTFPYNGTTTTCEAMWMGVPVITLAGKWHSARVGVSLLSAVNLEDYIAVNHEEYIECAVRKAANPGMLAALRRELRMKMKASRLMDKMSFVNGLEKVFREMLAIK